MRVTTMGITVVLWLTVACVPGDDGFRARLAEGCTSQAECDELEDEAKARFANCINASRDGRGCNEQMQDRFSATRLRNERREAEDRHTANRNRSHAGPTDEASLLNGLEGSCSSCAPDPGECAMGLHIDFCAPPISKLGSSCADIEALEAAAKSQVNKPSLVAEYRTLARSRREARIRSITFEINARFDTKPALSELDDPSAARRSIPAAQALLDELRCYDPGAAAQSQAQFTAWAAALETAVSDEEKCRETPQCLGQRETARVELVASPFEAALCEVIRDRHDTLRDQRDAAQDMARERRNPSGVVDMALLHDLGQRIQDDADRVKEDDTKIAHLKTKFTSIAHRPFSDATCPKTP
jgi:hypothetical protein